MYCSSCCSARFVNMFMFVDDSALVMMLFGGIFEVPVVKSLIFFILYLNFLICALSVIGLTLAEIAH